MRSFRIAKLPYRTVEQSALATELDTMDSTDDATKQLYSFPEYFCDKPYCLGKEWHEWGCCSSTELEDTSFLFDVNEELLLMSNHEEPSQSQAPPIIGRYAPPKTNEAVTQARAESIPKNTRDNMCKTLARLGKQSSNSH